MKNFSKSLVVFSLILVNILFCACGSKKEKAIIDNFTVESVTVFHLPDNYYNIEIGLTNNSDTAEIFDFSKIKVVGDNLEYTISGEKEYESKQYFKWSFSLSNGYGEFEVGAHLQVFYDDEIIANVTVEEF